MRYAVTLLTLAISSTPCTAQTRSPAHLVEATLTRLPPPVDQSFAVRLTVNVSSGWHIGAVDPGAAGLPTSVTWALPAGWTLVELRWPAPRLAMLAQDTVFIHEGKVHVDAIFRVGDATAEGLVGAAISYGVCREICIPGVIEVTLADSMPQRRSVPPRFRD